MANYWSVQYFSSLVGQEVVSLIRSGLLGKAIIRKANEGRLVWLVRVG